MATREPARRFQDLVVWQKSHQLALMVYRTTVTFPKYELYALTSQMRRAAVSVPANIAEGFKKRGRADKVRLLNVSEASLEELRYYFILAGDLGYMPQPGDGLLDEVARMLSAYSRTLRSPSPPSSPSLSTSS